VQVLLLNKIIILMSRFLNCSLSFLIRKLFDHHYVFLDFKRHSLLSSGSYLLRFYIIFFDHHLQQDFIFYILERYVCSYSRFLSPTLFLSSLFHDHRFSSSYSTFHFTLSLFSTSSPLQKGTHVLITKYKNTLSSTIFFSISFLF